MKKIKDDPAYDREKAAYLLKSFVGLSKHTINKKVTIMVEHFRNNVMQRIGGKAKAMIVTRSRLHAVRFKLAVDAFRLRRSGTTKITLEKGTKELEPMTPKNEGRIRPEDIESLSQIIKELNERFGTDFTEEDKVFIRQLEQRIANDPALEASIKVNPPEDARLTFNQVVNDKL